jgi:adenosylcobinamide kinase/adenosylcobinamide-phosphate guanylyltransferase
MTTTLVTGPVRSGKSRHAEDLLAHHAEVLYVATGPLADTADPEWSARVHHHRARRAAGWRTVETLGLPAALDGAGCPVLVDCLGTWLAGLVDEAGWEDLGSASAHVANARAELLAALGRVRQPVVLVTNEVGWSLVPETPSGRFFADELGRLNAAVSAAADRVHLVVAGRVLDLTSAPLVPEAPPSRTLDA